MNKYFEIRTARSGMEYGMIENIPEGTSDEVISERMVLSTETDSIVMVEDIPVSADVIINWVQIDFEEPKELSVVAEILENASELGIESDIVYSALFMMKSNNSLSIDECIITSFNNQMGVYS